MSLDAPTAGKTDNAVRRILFTLPAGLTEDVLKEIVKRLEKKGYVVAEIEDLQAGMTLMSDENPGVYIN